MAQPGMHCQESFPDADMGFLSVEEFYQVLPENGIVHGYSSSRVVSCAFQQTGMSQTFINQYNTNILFVCRNMLLAEQCARALSYEKPSNDG
jgi:hypothetical protein